MSDYRFKTIATWLADQTMYPLPEYQAFVEKIQAKVGEMVSEGKSDGWVDMVINNDGTASSHRFWIDQAAAQEFADFATSMEYVGHTATVTIEEVTG